MKKLCCLLIGILLLCCGCAQSDGTARYAPDRHQYDAETRLEQNENTENLNTNACSITVPPDKEFEYMTLSSDVVLAGTVADDGVTTREPLLMSVSDGPEADVTAYQVNVREVWQGECDEEQITLKFYWPHQTRPFKNDELILFLVKQGSGFYTPVTADNDSVFVINPPENKLFAMSTRQYVVAYDNQKIKTLKSDVADTVADFRDATEYTYAVGAVGLLSLTEDDPLYDKYWEMYHDHPYGSQYAEIFE